MNWIISRPQKRNRNRKFSPVAGLPPRSPSPAVATRHREDPARRGHAVVLRTTGKPLLEQHQLMRNTTPTLINPFEFRIGIMPSNYVTFPGHQTRSL
jgi:hypothetical protein